MATIEQDLSSFDSKPDGPIASWLRKRKSQKSLRASAKQRGAIPRSTPPFSPISIGLPTSPVTPTTPLTSPPFPSPPSSRSFSNPFRSSPVDGAPPVVPPKFSNGPRVAAASTPSPHHSPSGPPPLEPLPSPTPPREASTPDRPAPPLKAQETTETRRPSTEHSRPSTASTHMTNRVAEPRPARSSPTDDDPLSSKPSAQPPGPSALQLPLAFTKLTRDRGFSTSTPPPPPLSPTMRPSTSVSEHHPAGSSMLHPRPSTASGPVNKSTGSSLGVAKSARPRKLSLKLDSYHAEEVRASFRSALTTGSSVVANSSATERSSVMTKSSSMSEWLNGDLAGDKSGGMSVDEAISMYANGFDDTETDEKDEKEGVDPWSVDEDDNDAHPHSVRLAEAMNGSIGEASPSRAALTPPTPTLPSRLASLDVPRQAPPMPTVDRRDRYGFRKESQQITLEQYERWNVPYSENLARRKKKWVALLTEHGLTTVKPVQFPPTSAKVKRYIRKGIPPEWRGAAWFWYAGGHARMQRYPSLYHDLVDQAKRGEMSETDRELIERDLHRTFPDNVKFKPDAPAAADASDPRQTAIPTPPVELAETPTLHSLRRVLHAFSIHNPRIGYCQSLNFLAGLLLLFMDEHKAFWMLDIITRVYLPGTHEVSLEGANVDLAVLMASIQESMPAVWAKIGGELDGTMSHDRSSTHLPPITLCTTAWFMSCFIGTLPIETVLRVWDSFFYESSKTLFRVSLAIFKVGEPEIRAVNDSMEIFQVVQTIPRRLLDANALMEACFKRRNGFGHLSQETIDERRRAWRIVYSRERAMGGTGEPVPSARMEVEPPAYESHVPTPLAVESNADLLAQPFKQGLKRVGSRARLKRIHLSTREKMT